MFNRIAIIILNILFIVVAFAQSGLDSSGTSPAKEHAQSINLTWLFFKTMGILILIIALIIATVYLMKKYLFQPTGLSGDKDWIRVLSHTQIQPKKFLTLVRVFDRVILLGSTETTVQRLAEFDNLNEIKPYLDQIEKKFPSGKESRFLGLIKKQIEA